MLFYVIANLSNRYPYQQISIIPPPLHNHPEMQNNPDIQSQYTSSEMTYQINHKMRPILCIMIPHSLKLPRAFQRLANYNKPGLKE